MLLAGRRAIITGSSRGLGRAYALALAREGASVVVNGTTPDLVEEVVREIRGEGGTAVPSFDSVSSFAAAGAIVATAVREFGGIDILVNNAGVTAERMVFNMSDEEFRRPMEVDYYGTFACTRHASREMRAQRWGRIVTRGNTSVQHGLLGGTNVAAAKGGIHAMTYTWAAELGRYGVTANCVIPFAYTRLHDPLIRKSIEVARERGDDRVPTFEELVAATPKPDEITSFLVYLCSDEAGWINGQVFSMQRDRVALWSHPVEKAELRAGGALGLAEIRARAEAAFAGEVEPVGGEVAWLQQ